MIKIIPPTIWLDTYIDGKINGLTHYARRPESKQEYINLRNKEIVDLVAFSNNLILHHADELWLASRIMKNYELNYPELLKHTLIIPANKFGKDSSQIDLTKSTIYENL